jgi:succinate dehydrogenase / fumarate reductase iron-sulfur subunit
MKFKIRRFDGESSWYDIFEVKVRPRMSVLDGLFQIQDELDGSLAFRYSCRGGVCGSSAMLINKKHRLACRTQVAEIENEHVISPAAYGPVVIPLVKTGDHILVEPLPNLPVIRDLIVDLKPFFKHYEYIQPWFEGDNPNPWKKRRCRKLILKKWTGMLPVSCAACAMVHVPSHPGIRNISVLRLLQKPGAFTQIHGTRTSRKS